MLCGLSNQHFQGFVCLLNATLFFCHSSCMKRLMNSNLVPSNDPNDDSVGPSSGSPDASACREPAPASDAPDSQQEGSAAPAIRSGQSGDTAPPVSDVGLDSTDQFTDPHPTRAASDREAQPFGANPPAHAPELPLPAAARPAQSPTGPVVILQRPVANPSPPRPTEDPPAPNDEATNTQSPGGHTPSRFASPPITVATIPRAHHAPILDAWGVSGHRYETS